MKRKMISLVLTLCLGLTLTLGAVDEFAKPQSKDALKKMKKADKAIKDKDYDAALALYSEIVQLEPNYAPAYFTTAQILRIKEAFDLALTNYEKALAISPDFAVALNEYVRTLMSLSRKAIDAQDLQKAAFYDEKILNTKDIETTHPQELQQIAYQMGSIRYTQNEFDKSIVAFQRFLAIPEIEKKAPSNCALANYMLGMNFSRLDQPVQANPYLEKFISGPQDAMTTPWLPLAYFLLANNHYLTLDKQVIKIKEDKTIDALTMFNRIADAAKASTGVQPNFAKAIELKPDLEDAYVMLGNYYFFCQDFDNAQAIYNDLIAKFPASPAIANYKAFLPSIDKEREAIKTLKAKKKTK